MNRTPFKRTMKNIKNFHGRHPGVGRFLCCRDNMLCFFSSKREDRDRAAAGRYYGGRFFFNYLCKALAAGKPFAAAPFLLENTPKALEELLAMQCAAPGML